MAALQFPVNPDIGQVYDSGEYSYSFDGDKWTSIRRQVTNVFDTVDLMKGKDNLRVGDYVKVINPSAEYRVNPATGDGILLDNGLRAEMLLGSNGNAQMSGVFGKNFVGNISKYDGQGLADSNNLYQYPDDSGMWYGVNAGTVLPVDIPANPAASGDWELVNALTSTGDGSELSVLATGSSAHRTLGDRFAELVNVKDFGAVGDGVTDDTVAILLCMREYSSVYFPRGTYMVSTIITPRSNTLIGESRDSVILKHISGTDNPLIRNRSYRLEVRDLTLLGSGLNGVGTPSPNYKASGILCSSGELYLHNLHVSKFGGNAIWTGNISDNWSVDTYVDRCTITNCIVEQGGGTDLLGDCIRLERTNNMVITDNEISGGLSGLRTQLYCKDIYIAGNHVYGSYADVGITIAHSTDFQIINNDCHSHFGHGIEADGCHRGVIQGNKCHDNDKHGILLAEYTTPGSAWFAGYIDGVLIPPGSAIHPADVLVSSNKITDNGHAGLAVVAPELVVVNNNSFYNNSTASGGWDCAVRIATTPASGNVQDVVFNNNVYRSGAYDVYAYQVANYQYNAERSIRSYNDTCINCRKAKVPIAGSDNLITFMDPADKPLTANLEGATVLEDLKLVPHGYYWTVKQTTLNWDTIVPPVVRTYLLKIRYRNTSAANNLHIQECELQADGSKVFRNTLSSNVLGTSPGWQTAHYYFQTSAMSNPSYNILRVQFDENVNVPLDIAYIELTAE